MREMEDVRAGPEHDGVPELEVRHEGGPEAGPKAGDGEEVEQVEGEGQVVKEQVAEDEAEGDPLRQAPGRSRGGGRDREGRDGGRGGGGGRDRYDRDGRRGGGGGGLRRLLRPARLAALGLLLPAGFRDGEGDRHGLVPSLDLSGRPAWVVARLAAPHGSYSLPVILRFRWQNCNRDIEGSVR